MSSYCTSCESCTNGKYSPRNSSEDDNETTCERKNTVYTSATTSRFESDTYFKNPPYFGASFLPVYDQHAKLTDLHQNGTSTNHTVSSLSGNDKRRTREFLYKESHVFSPEVIHRNINYNKPQPNTTGGHIKIEDVEISDETKEENDNEETERKQNRFSDQQLRVLIDTWMKLHNKIESSDSDAWRIITEKVNHVTGLQKTLRQVKRKIQVMKQEYRASKKNTFKNGYSRKTCKFFEEMESIMGTSDIVNIPALISAGKKRKNSHNIEEENASSGNENEIDADNEEDEPEPIKQKTIKSSLAQGITIAIQNFQKTQGEQMERFLIRMEKMEERAQERNNNLIIRLAEILRR